MWRHRTRLPHALEPASYFDEANHERELDALFRRGWHCLATVEDIPSDGDFITRDLAGVPLLIRRAAGGALHAFINVCAHRHALLTREPCGQMNRLRCS